MGVVIPKEKAKELKIRAEEEIWVDIQKKENPLKELWGAFRTEKTGKQLLRELRKEKWSKYV